MLRLLTSVFLLAALATATPASAQYVAGFEDVPLAPGLAMVEDSAVSFDKPEGRIVAAAARGVTTDRTRIGDFYRSTLHQLGWTETGAHRAAGGWNQLMFQREEEQLAIALGGRPGKVEVRYQLSPKPGYRNPGH